jgi:hypothetical protein
MRESGTCAQIDELWIRKLYVNLAENISPVLIGISVCCYLSGRMLLWLRDELKRHLTNPRRHFDLQITKARNLAILR